MKRIIVLGGTGFFGALIVERLRATGLEPLVASRNSAELKIDANNAESLRANLKQRDVVIDAAGPFHQRTPALVEAAARMGFDVVDVSDSPDYSSMVYDRAAPIAAAGIRVLTACSMLSTVSAAVLGVSSVNHPRRLTAYLRPARKLTDNPGSVSSFLGALTGRARKILFPPPWGARSGLLAKSVDSVTLPRLFPSLREIELVIDAGIPGVNAVIRESMRRPKLRQLATRFQSYALAIAKRVGPKVGVLAYEIVATGGNKHQFFTGENLHLAAVLPAVMAGRAIAEARFPQRGVVAPSHHVTPAELFEAMFREGITVVPPWGT